MPKVNHLSCQILLKKLGLGCCSVVRVLALHARGPGFSPSTVKKFAKCRSGYAGPMLLVGM